MRPLLPSSLVAVAVALLATRDASADDTLRLTWKAPAGCPSIDDVRAATLREVDARAANSGVLEADAYVEQREATSWAVRLRTRRGMATGEREIEAETCDGVAQATAVVLALALVPPSEPEPEPERVPGAAAAPPTPPPADRDAGASAFARTDEAHALALGASLAAVSSTLPAAALGGSVTLAWTPDRARIELDVRRWASQSETVSTSAAGARFSMTSLGGRGCWAALRTHTFDLSPCAGADVHLVSAPGHGADANYAASGAWTAIGAGALGRLHITSWLALRARAEVVVPLSRPTFVVENEGFVHRPSILGAAASLGIEALFL
ncbi:MAG: hypothetical protein BGO98_21285 [Myxococcales bacterium 68-20]|nr:hypothetical protein [Myxococcales bacterium]OJY28092.1 MAG: hypothetical protein BGO98_21285 [Myxococcales bacterium 68-20]